jgi:hypothetical protein
MQGLPNRIRFNMYPPFCQVEELRRAKAPAALPADSGVRSAFDGGLLADLPARIAEMEGEIRGLRDINRSKTFKYIHVLNVAPA